MNSNSPEKSKYEKRRYGVKPLFWVLVAIFLVWEVFSYVQTRKWANTHHDLERGKVGMDLINPKVLRYELPDIATDIKAEVEDMVGEFQQENKLTSFGMYIRDLDSGYGFGINENELFIPASLLKMFSMVTYLKLSETDATILEKRLLYNGEDLNNLQTIAPENKMRKGESYTIDDLIHRSIVYSDNNANALLMNAIDQDAYERVFIELGIPFTTSFDQKTVTPKMYASLFRVLYNATFLNEENSQKTLKLLTGVKFDAGLQAGLNGTVKLANKFGERQITENGATVNYLHDCGVVYAKHPYVLCMMTKGADLETLETIIRDISGIVYSKMKY